MKMKKLICFLPLLIILLASCRSSKELHKKEVTLHRVDTLDHPKKEISFSIEDTLLTIKPKKKRKKEEKRGEVILPKLNEITQSTTSLSTNYKGINRIQFYEFKHTDVPAAFHGFRIAFVSDLHYTSLFKKDGLLNLVRLLNEQKADVLLMGGDFYEGCHHIPELFAELAKVKTVYGSYTVLGNNDYEACYEQGVKEMKKHGIKVLEHKVDTLRKGKEFIQITGIRNPFNLKQNGVSPTLSLHPNDFVILLTHTPDYAEDVSVDNTDLALAGHTHGGQVRILGRAPIIPSKYGQRFLTGVRYTTAGVPLIITNGLGTSRINLRISSPSEIVIITLLQMGS